MMHKTILTLAVAAGLTLNAGQSAAESLVEPDYAGTGPKVVTPWYTHYSPANQKTDLDYIAGMRPHHAGALSMVDAYLASKNKQSRRLQALAKGIKHNQQFEITMLDTVEWHIKDITFKNGQAGWYQIATGKIAQHQRFMRNPPPANVLRGGDVSSAEDVRFAKAMIVHHDGALMMARDYLDNPQTNNSYLERMNLDVLRDQAQEIALMRDIIADYPGNACDIVITPDMIDGMEDMMHHMDFSSVNCGQGQEQGHGQSHHGAPAHPSPAHPPHQHHGHKKTSGHGVHPH